MFMALLLLLLNLCSPVVNSALTKETQTYITVDFVNTYSSYEYECTSESSMGSFNVAELHLISATSADYSSFFVTISTSDLAFTLPRACTQYGGGDYIHQGCDISTKSWSTYSSEGLLVTIPIESHHQKHQRAGSGGAMWTICVGSGEAQDSSSSALKAVGNVRLSTSTSKHPLVSNAASKTSTAPRLVETQTERKEKDVKERRNRLSPADDTEHLVLLASEQALSIPSGSKSKAQDDSGVEEGQVKAAAAPSTCANVSVYADGYCDNENNVAECDYDGGDCCFEDCTHSQCFHLLESYPKFCHKDETIMVNYLKEHTLTSTDYCGPNFDASTKGARCSLRTAVNFCQNNVVGDHRCIIKIPAGTVELNASSIQLNDNGRSLVIRGDSSATSVVTNTAGGDLRFLYILFASDLSSTTEFVLEHLTITGFSATAGWGGAIYCKYLNKGAFNDLVLVNNNARYGGAMYTNRVDNIAFSSLTFSGNSATEKGGGMYVLSSVDMSATYADMFFDGNSATDDGGMSYSVSIVTYV
jgi:predicted outer membrane repeat protein